MCVHDEAERLALGTSGDEREKCLAGIPVERLIRHVGRDIDHTPPLAMGAKERAQHRIAGRRRGEGALPWAQQTRDSHVERPRHVGPKGHTTRARA